MADFPWYKHYPKGVAQEINPDQYSSLVEMLDEASKKFSSSPAFVNMDKRISYKEMKEKATELAAFFQSIGLKKGDRIVVQMPNLLQYPVIIYGALKAGLIVVNTNPLYTPREMEHQFKDSGARAIIILANFAYNLEKIIQKTNIETVIITEIGDLLGGIKSMLVNFVVKKIKKMVPDYHLPEAIKFKAALKSGRSKTFTPVELIGKDVAFLQYTGGTTGVSKGATLTHRNIVSNILQSKEWFVGLKEKEEVVITALPLYHIFALTANFFNMYMIGTLDVLITNPRDMKAFIKELKKYPFTVFLGVNTLFNGLLHQPDISDVNFSHLKIAVAGGMALQKPVATLWKDKTGNSIAEGYGLSETSPVLSCNPLNGTERIGTIGIPYPSTEMKIMDENGNEMPLGEPGEICARGPQVMPGYWNREDETAKCFFGEWFKTGDIGVMDEDGFFSIVDRKKDMILVSGFNVYPNEIEDVISGHPKVLEVAAIGIPDVNSNEAVKVFIVKKDESLTEQEVHDYCVENLTGYKRPKAIEFMKELPKSNVGKILRKNLREAVS
jgi:long-chain acyl-CoA synthetase